jgi:hypothetical protein
MKVCHAYNVVIPLLYFVALINAKYVHNEGALFSKKKQKNPLIVTIAIPKI